MAKGQRKTGAIKLTKSQCHQSPPPINTWQDLNYFSILRSLHTQLVYNAQQESLPMDEILHSIVLFVVCYENALENQP